MKKLNITSKLKKLVTVHFAVVALVLSGAAGIVLANPSITSAAQQACPDNLDSQAVDLSTGANCAQGKGTADNLAGQGGIFQTVVNILLFLVGAVAVIMLVIGGLRYVTSNGDQNAVTGAKNTIMYAIIGIVIAFLAYAAVNFVIGQLGAGSGSAIGQ